MSKYRIALVFALIFLCATPLVIGAYLNFAMTGTIVDTGLVTFFLDDVEYTGGNIDWGTVLINSSYSKGLHVNNYKNTPQTVMLTCDNRQGLTLSWTLNNTEVPARTWREGTLTLTVADTATDGNFSLNCQLYP